MAETAAALAIVMMGVTGSGKTTIGKTLAERIGCTFVDADDFHSAANKAKMAAGVPLTDEDRAPWLKSLNAVLLGWVNAGTPGIMACSALKQEYRETLVQGIDRQKVAFVWLDAAHDLLAQRLAARHHEFMNPGLLDSQIATLEPPADALRVVNDRSPEEVVDQVLAGLGRTKL